MDNVAEDLVPIGVDVPFRKRQQRGERCTRVEGKCALPGPLSAVVANGV